ncbi:MAG: NAD(P)H-hydrate epimerase [Thaumarchaeota archaeon]|nr:NAD(P)H-hydrate epimerase [Nitrososphaerota archaeon]
MRPAGLVAMKVVDGLAYVSAEEMALLDRTAIEEFGVDVLSLMENAGAATAEVARRMFGGGVGGKRVGVLVGKGNNGGDGLVAARRLHNWGANVVVILSEKESMGNVPKTQLRAVEALGVDIKGPEAALGDSDLLIDALLGYNSRGSPREPVASIIAGANRSKVPMLAVDLPSGLDATSGESNEPCVVAKATITMALPKLGFLNAEARNFVGELWLGDISLPAELYRRYSVRASPFDRQSVVRIG